MTSAARLARIDLDDIHDDRGVVVRSVSSEWPATHEHRLADKPGYLRVHFLLAGEKVDCRCTLHTVIRIIRRQTCRGHQGQNVGSF